MNENVMSQLDAELEHAGEETALSPKMLLLEQLRITPEKELPKMEFLFQLFGKPCFPRRELVAITGKAKSGKTFVTSMLMAVGNLNPNVNPNICQLPLKRMREEPLRVLWYDTEQSDESTQDILKNRIIRLLNNSNTNLTNPTNNLWSEKSIDVFNVRGVPWKERRDLLCEAVMRCKPDLVIVDGIRDLVNDINDGVLAQEVMEELMHLATEHDWNKAFEVYSCEKLMPQRIFSLEQTLTRKYDIERTMYFEVGDDGLPVTSSNTSQGREKERGEQLPPLNQTYRVCDEEGRRSFDVMRLFLDAMRGEDEVGGGELRERVMQLSGIAIPFKYNQLLTEALNQKIIERGVRGGRTFYRPAPF